MGAHIGDVLVGRHRLVESLGTADSAKLAVSPFVCSENAAIAVMPVALVIHLVLSDALFKL